MEVAQWSARLFSKLAFELSDANLLNTAWEWFIGETGGGLSTALLGLKRHPDLNELVVSILLQFARYNFIELFSIHIKRASIDTRSFANTIVVLLKPLCESSTAAADEVIHRRRELTCELPCFQLLNSGIIDEWIDIAMEAASDDYKNSNDSRIASFTLLYKLWVAFPDKFEEAEEKSNAVIALFNKVTLVGEEILQ